VIVSKSSLLEYKYDKLKKQYKDFDDERFKRDVCQDLPHFNIDELKKRRELQKHYIYAISQELR
jgi:hypothetical protein